MMDKAISDYSKTIELNPSYEKAYYSRGLLFGAKECGKMRYVITQKE
ncbi:MAG: tetratricopeptide repeat protein [Bacteroidota bacterium]|nr:MAG: tetratricopeptide repeat protein [Bacteroidota bacterium]